jgi:triosephosphate isomerase
LRPKVIAGNWKMYKDVRESAELIQGIKSKLALDSEKIQVVLCPPFTSLAAAQSLLQGSSILLGAQNMYFEAEGAYTGEVSANMLKSAGCTHVIVGHSERRQHFGETNELVNKKVKKALESGLIPIICVGETLEEREKGITDQIVSTQVKSVLRDILSTEVVRCIIAYEPVWAIGTGKNATPEQAEEVHKLVRKIIGQLHSWTIAEQVVIQYGGSVKPENADALLRQPNIDGALVGGASLKAQSFVQIVQAARMS